MHYLLRLVATASLQVATIGLRGTQFGSPRASCPVSMSSSPDLFRLILWSSDMGTSRPLSKRSSRSFLSLSLSLSLSDIGTSPVVKGVESASQTSETVIENGGPLS